MEEAEVGEGRQLRQSTLSHQPGQYEELQTYGVQIPSYVHPDPVYDPSTARHCSFPTVPLDQPGGADAYVAAREKGELDEQKDGFGDDGDEEGSQQASFADEGKDDDNDEKSNIPVTYEPPERSIKQGESLKEFLLSVTNDLDWGSSESEDEWSNKGQHDTGGDDVNCWPIEWCQVPHGGQWIIFRVLCQYQSFASAAKALKISTPDLITFVVRYIRFHRKTKQWAKAIEEASVSDLIQKSGNLEIISDEKDVLVRPRLPTDVFSGDEREQAVKYLRQVGQSKFVKDVMAWHGHSTEFHTLPVEPEMMAGCIMILNKEGKLDLNSDQFPQDEKPLSWLERPLSGCQDLKKRLAELRAYLPRLGPSPLPNPSVSSPTANLKETEYQRCSQSATGNNAESSAEGSNTPSANPQHRTWSSKYSEAAGLDRDQAFAQDNLFVTGRNSQHSPAQIDYYDMDELYDPQLLPQRRVPSVDMRGYPGLEPQAGLKDGSAQSAGSIEAPQPFLEELKVPTVDIREASPQAQFGERPPSDPASAALLLPPIPFLHPPVRPSGLSLNRDTCLLPQGSSNEVTGHSHSSRGINTAAPPTFAFGSYEVDQQNFALSLPLNASSVAAPDCLTLDLPPLGNILHLIEPANFHFPSDAQGQEIQVANQERHRPNNQRGPSPVPGFIDPAASEEARLRLKSLEASKIQGETMMKQAGTPLPIGSQRDAENASALDNPRDHKNMVASPILVHDDIESPATLSSSKPSRKRRIDDSDDDYQPRSKRPRKSNARKSATQSKNTSSFKSIQPQPASQLQTGTAGVPQPVKRGRGRPRKNPRPENLAVQAAPAQPVLTQAPANDTDAIVVAPPSRILNSGREVSAPSAPANSTDTQVASFTQPTSHPSYNNAPRATLSYSNPHQDRTVVGKNGPMHPSQANSYEEFWSKHKNLDEAALQEYRTGYSTSDNDAHSFIPFDAETKSSTQAHRSASAHEAPMPNSVIRQCHDQGLGMHSQDRPTPQEGISRDIPMGVRAADGHPYNAIDTQRQSWNYTDLTPAPARLDRYRSPSVLDTIAQQVRNERARAEATARHSGFAQRAADGAQPTGVVQKRNGGAGTNDASVESMSND